MAKPPNYTLAKLVREDKPNQLHLVLDPETDSPQQLQIMERRGESPGVITARVRALGERDENRLGQGGTRSGFVAQYFLLCLQPVICRISIHSAAFLKQLICALANFFFDFGVGLVGFE